MDTWQDIAATGLVVLAGGYLAFRGWLVFWKQRGGCGSCSSCPSGDDQKKPIVSVESLTDTARK